MPSSTYHYADGNSGEVLVVHKTLPEQKNIEWLNTAHSGLWKANLVWKAVI